MRIEIHIIEEDRPAYVLHCDAPESGMVFAYIQSLLKTRGWSV